MLVALTLAALGVVASSAPVGAAQSQATQSQAVTIEARISGKKIELWLIDIGEPIGALEFTISGLSPLDGDCEVTGGFGACNDQQGDLLVVAINPTGFDEITELANAKVESTIDVAAVAINIVQATDVAGQPVAAGTSITSTPSSGGSVPTAVWIAVPLIAVVAAFVGWRIKTSGNKTPQADG